jgi:NADH:ubiquinone oxidoreductase subunit K
LPTVKRAIALFIMALTTMLVAAPMAFAENGEGWIKADDKTVTLFCFGVMAFFVTLVIGMSLIQGALERRKEKRRYDIERLG